MYYHYQVLAIVFGFLSGDRQPSAKFASAVCRSYGVRSRRPFRAE